MSQRGRASLNFAPWVPSCFTLIPPGCLYVWMWVLYICCVCVCMDVSVHGCVSVSAAVTGPSGKSLSAGKGGPFIPLVPAYAAQATAKAPWVRSALTLTSTCPGSHHSVMERVLVMRWSVCSATSAVGPGSGHTSLGLSFLTGKMWRQNLICEPPVALNNSGSR